MSSHVLEATVRLALTDGLQVLSVSEGIEALLGFTPEDFLFSKVSLKERIHPHDSDTSGALFSLEIHSGSGTFNIRLRHADGRIRCIKGHCTKEAGAEGQVILELLLQDATSLAEDVDELPMMANFRAIMENSEDYIYFKDRNHVFTAVSQTGIPSDGKCRADVVGKTDYDLLREESADALYLQEEQIFAGLPMVQKIHELQIVPGKRSWLDNRMYPIKTSSGEITGVWGMARDITKRMQTEETLRESEEILRESQRVAGLGSYVLDIRTGEWKSSDVLDEIYGIDESYERTVDRWAALVHLDDRTMMVSHFKDEVLGRGGAFNKEYRIVRPADQAVRWVHGLGRLEFDVQGQPVKMRGTIQDITERRQAEERLRLAARVFTHAREGILITAADGAIIDVNDMFTQITGYTREEVLGRNPSLLKSGRQGKDFYAKMWRALIEKGYWFGEIWNRGKDGHIYAEMLTISALRNESGGVQQYVALFSDITTAKAYERQLKHIANYDVLTGLPNRVLLADRMNQAMVQFPRLNRAMVQSRRRGQLVAVAYLDLNGFKVVNDRHGHDVGERLLAVVASRMKKVLRKGDTLARLGGEEFVAVLLDLENTEASIPMLNRMLKAASQPVQIGNLDLQVSVSIGITFYPQEEEAAADQLLRQADQAMYQAKLAGKNRYHLFDFSQDRTVRGRLAGIDRIRQALAAGEFVLYFQPKVNMRKGTVVGAEALIRWQHPEQGLLLPGVFLPVIEDHPLAVELGEWVIDTALTQMERWRAAGLDIPVSVNVGARQLHESNFVNRLATLLAAHPRIKPSSLELEILETSALEDMAQVSQLLEGCRKIGVMLALDDFGTGYSSLSYLKRLPVDVLKIDQSFVRDILNDPENLAILDGIMGLAAAFRRKVVAEGVETVDHGLMLLRMGCEQAQGFGIARPMPAGDFPDWAAAWQPDPRWINVLPASQDERQLLYADVEHRAWIAAIESFLKGERHLPPRLSLDQCRFSEWMTAKSLAGRGESPEFQALQDLHRQIHALAEDIVEFRDRDHTPEPLARLGELHSLRDALLNQLELYRRS